MPEERAVVTEKMVASSAPCGCEGGPRGSMLDFSLFPPPLRWAPARFPWTEPNRRWQARPPR